MILCLPTPRVLQGIANWLDVSETPAKVDCVVILPGDECTRPFVAAAMIKAGLAEKVLVLETVKSAAVRDSARLTTHEITRRVLRLRGISDEQIVLMRGKSASTWNDAQQVKNYLDAKTQRVAVVTNHYHTRRARWVFQCVLGSRAAPRSFSIVGAPTDSFDQSDWWQTKAGIKAYLSEYSKYFYYRVRYGYFKWILLIIVVAIFVHRIRRQLRQRFVEQGVANAEGPTSSTNRTKRRRQAPRTNAVCRYFESHCRSVINFNLGSLQPPL